ncbi:putative MFS monocarboxylate transporter [Xylogone sp. PMI_703]|nr:putative MFS monocarboxylate transporter [Xylogone sp. PMI_703]
MSHSHSTESVDTTVNNVVEDRGTESPQMAQMAVEDETPQPDSLSPKMRKINSVLVVLAAFLAMFTTCGLNFAFGVYQELYESMSIAHDPNPFTGASPARIGLIGTLAVSLMSLGAPLASAWCKSYSPRTINLVGGLIFALANVLASFSQKLWQFMLTQGILLGVGTCLTYIPAVTVSPGWFNKHRGLAVGIVTSGTGVGGVAWAPTLRALNASIGFRNTLRFTGAVSFLLIALSSTMLRWEPETERRNRVEQQATRSRFFVPLINWRVARSRKFIAQCISAGLQGAAYYAPVYFFSSYARTLGYSAATGAILIALSNAASAIGKVIVGFVADRVGRMNALLFCTFVSAAIAFGLWLPSCLSGGDRKGRTLFVTFTILYGVFAGAYISLLPTVLVELFGVQHYTSVNGFLYGVRGITSLIGTPVAGVLIRGGSESVGMSKSYTKTTILIGALLAGATVGVTWARVEAALGLQIGTRGSRRIEWRA